MSAETAETVKPQEGWMQSSTCRAVDEAGRTEGRAYGLAEAMAREWVRLLGRQAREKFGTADLAGRDVLQGLAQAFAGDILLELAERLIGASSRAEWLAGITVPPPAPGFPEYTKDPEIDLEPSGPSIDTYIRATRIDGGEQIIHLRFQKWYQPDLDRHLFESSCKLQRKYRQEPTVLVFLLWPPAEGPGTTGRYEELDGEGKVKRVFTYIIRRAWEMTAEEVTQAPGTMLLAPLTKGSRERMPEIVEMVKKGFDRCAVDAKTRGMVWDAFYWSMGLVCDLDAAHRALGEEVVSAIFSSPNYLAAKAQAFMGGYSTAQSEGPPMAARTLVLRQGTVRFGPWPEAEKTLAGMANVGDLETLAQRVLSADSWPALLGTP